jgi:alanine racemase
MCVVKASCYGHSDTAAAPYIQNELGVGWFAVSNLDEAVRLRKIGITGEILILGYTAPEEAAELEKYDIIQAITDEEYAAELSACAQKSVRCHAAVDTGMTRIGVRGTAEEIADSLCRIAAREKIKLEGAFTHYAVADTATEDCIAYTKAQTELLFGAADIAAKKGLKLSAVHSLNSAGGLFHYTSRSALARLGIILYGLTPDVSLKLPFKPKPVMTLKSTVSQVKEIERGTDVSYGRTYTAPDKVKIATVTCGYADGYPRALSNKGEVLIGGRRCRIVGRVCMDQFMCDVTGLDVKQGDTVTLIGEDGGERITADDIAQITGTIGYEIVCGISERVPRVAVRNGDCIGIYKL